ncbi:holo-[acyl-carrier-protein] synthase [Marinobacterium nitratireducens]|uniref:Holo-[acyl-carrier-protein] synthase n=1 Tax=Marinobacterium nitratireducens TaxID=518897 RepID=A0A917ZGN6_9GAMM|nr:holo-ACP synthase [Marinobacterium nitratireducens]GGO82426.1 holo-[acyl-carrier-protein] synthase [Marinobacterium nitratireducens]
MIAGIGTDLLEIARIEAALARTPGLAARILTPAELVAYEASRDRPRYLAKRFAAKEAAVKALGTGIGRGVSWQHLEVGHDSLGKPELRLSGGADARARELGVARMHLSYSDEQQMIVAFVVAESGGAGI